MKSGDSVEYFAADLGSVVWGAPSAELLKSAAVLGLSSQTADLPGLLVVSLLQSAYCAVPTA